MPRASTGRREFVGWALAALAAGTRHASASTSPISDPVEDLYTTLLAAMKAGASANFDRRFEIIAPAVDRALDLTAILSMSVGLRWATLAADEQAALLAAFRRYTVSTYVVRFDSFSGQRFEVQSDTASSNPDQRILHTRIVPASGDPHAIDYLMHRSGETWKVVDVLLDGTISQVAIQRSDFRRILTDAGVSGLLASLNHKSANFAAGVS
jgi:phospholipid transport system substrate-binding protein